MKNIFVILVYTLIIILCLEVGLTIKRPNIPVYQSILKGKPYPAESFTKGRMENNIIDFNEKDIMLILEDIF